MSTEEGRTGWDTHGLRWSLASPRRPSPGRLCNTGHTAGTPARSRTHSPERTRKRQLQGLPLSFNTLDAHLPASPQAPSGSCTYVIGIFNDELFLWIIAPEQFNSSFAVFNLITFSSQISEKSKYELSFLIYSFRLNRDIC